MYPITYANSALRAHDPSAETSVTISKRGKAKVEIPTKEEIRAILGTSAEMWPYTKIERSRTGEQKVIAVALRPLIVTAIFTGLRCSELRGPLGPVPADARV